MVFHALTFARSRGRCWKPRPEAAVFNTSLGTWQMLMHWKTMFSCYYCIKSENICYNLRYFLHYFISPFHRCNKIKSQYNLVEKKKNKQKNNNTLSRAMPFKWLHVCVCKYVYVRARYIHKYWLTLQGTKPVQEKKSVDPDKSVFCSLIKVCTVCKSVCTL